MPHLEASPLETWIQTTQTILDRGIQTGRARIGVPAVGAPEAAPRRGRLLEAAQTIAERLGELALGDEERVDWLGIKMIGPDRWTIAPLNGNLYDGAAGLALFFAHFARTAGDEDARFLAESALAAAQRTLDTTARRGGLGGLGGLIHTFTHLGLLWARKDLLARAEELCAQVAAQAITDTRLDLMGGSAGNLLAAAGLARRTGSAVALAAARAAGARLLGTALPQATGVGWVTDLCRRPLGGFSHGAAGMAAALLDLHALTRDTRVHATATAALAYDRSLYHDGLRNWRDRRFTERPVAMNAWCHGAPGIGLMRLRWREQLDDTVDVEIQRAVDACLRDDLGTSHSLCHGAVGNVLLPWEWSQRGHRAEDVVNQRVDAILTSLENVPVCGSLPGVEVAGLFTGLAGIGLGLLRMAAPDQVPCPLTLQLPD